MAALDLLGRRWCLRILWELRNGALGARAILNEVDGLSSSVLYDRLRELTAAGLVVQGDNGEYGLSHLGAALGEALDPLDRWSKRWARST